MFFEKEYNYYVKNNFTYNQIVTILNRLFIEIDLRGGFNSKRNADAAHESLKLILKNKEKEIKLNYEKINHFFGEMDLNLLKYEDMIHFFGEMDLNLSLSKNNIYEKAFSIAAACGYNVDVNGEIIGLYGREGEIFYLFFKDNKFDYLMFNKKKFILDTIPKYDGYKGGW